MCKHQIINVDTHNIMYLVYNGQCTVLAISITILCTLLTNIYASIQSLPDTNLHIYTSQWAQKIIGPFEDLLRMVIEVWKWSSGRPQIYLRPLGCG